jgi:hypothetical protein
MPQAAEQTKAMQCDIRLSRNQNVLKFEPGCASRSSPFYEAKGVHSK